MILAFSDGATEVESPGGMQLTAQGFAELAATTLSKLPQPPSLSEFSKSLLHGIHQYHGGTDLEDDITLLTLCRAYVVPGHLSSIFFKMNSAFRIALSTVHVFAGLGLPNSISINFRAHKMVAANKIACLRSSVMWNSALGCGRGREANCTLQRVF